MAEMIPPYIHEDVRSPAEKKIFEVIREDNALDEWYCLHSLGLCRHKRQVVGEIDMVLIGPGGIYCLEVKGGRISRRNGIWYYTDRYGVDHHDSRGPFAQVAQALYSLRENVETKFGDEIKKYMFGYGVIFPDVQFSTDSPEWDQEIIYDVRDRFSPFAVYLQRLDSYWHTKIPGKYRLNGVTARKYVNFLRGDFEAIQSLESRLKGTEHEILRLTEQQYRALDRMSANPRLLFTGSAGTGKTLLALEKARRSAMQEKRVLLLCFNRVLAGRLSRQACRLETRKNIEVSSLHSFMYEIIRQAGFLEIMINDRRHTSKSVLFTELYPEYFIESLRTIDFEPFDCIVIDEGQDILCYEYFTALDYLLKGGFEQGEWTIFYDPNKQSGLYGMYSPDLVEDLKRFGAAEYRLDINCRNTKQIALQTSLISEFEMEKSFIDGEKVRIQWYRNDDDLFSKLNRDIHQLVSQGVPLHYLTIIYPGQNKKLHEHICNLEGNPVEITYENAGNLPENRVSFCTVQSYKGLENRVILFPGIEDITDKWTRVIAYTGMTRAREMLYIYLRENLKEDYIAKASGFGGGFQS